MKQLNVRLTADLYDAVQSLLQENLKMDLSTFVRELFIDALVIYGSHDRAIEVLAEMGQGHRIKQGPGLVLAMADRWRDEQAKTGAFREVVAMMSRLARSGAELEVHYLTRGASVSIPGLLSDGVERMSISGNGSVLAVGYRSFVSVIDVLTRGFVLRSAGRFPSLSPDGETLAFVSGRAVHLVSLKTGVRRAISLGRAFGVGGWSPDGAYLLAGARGSLSFWTWLYAVEVASGRYWPLLRLGEGDYGDHFCWVLRDLLSV